jgi:hypothetical protein
MKKYYFLIIVALILGLVLTGCTLLSNIGQVPTTEQSGITYLTKGTEAVPDEFPLYAGQDIPVGTVYVWNDGEELHVVYNTTGGWEMTETHLAVAIELEVIPQKNGNPIPGKFSYQCCYDENAAQWVFQIKEDGNADAGCDADDSPETCLTAITYTIPLDWVPDTELFIAAHAVVQKTTVITEAPYYASVVVDYSQGLTKGGDSVRWQRSTPEQGLKFETGQNEFNFFGLGFGGWIIVEFDCPIQNGEGDDIRIIEDTWGSYPLETAEVYASQDGTNWTDLGEADNTVRHIIDIHTVTPFDLGSLEWAKYIKIVDTSDPSVHNNNADGYDLNAVESLQDCVEIQEETAWAAGLDFPGKNWATYFTYNTEGLPPTISSTDLAGPYSKDEDGEFSVKTVNPEYGFEYPRVIFNYIIEDITLLDITSFEYFDGTTWGSMPMFDDGLGNVTGLFGPFPGCFLMEVDYSEETTFRINIGIVDTFPVTITLIDCDSNVVLATLSQDVAVFPETPLAVGDSYGGGIVAYILQPGESNGVYNYDENVQHGLIAYGGPERWR